MADVKINDLTLAGGISDSMQLETDISGLTANKVTALQLKTYANTGIDHGSLNGLSDDDHTQYSLADGTRWTATPTASRAVVSNGSGTLVVSTVTSTEIGYLGGVTSNIQTQLDSKLESSGEVDHGGVTGLGDDDHTQYGLADGTRWTTTPTANRVPISDSSGNLVVSSITDTELGYLDNVTSNIQTQLNTKFDASSDVDHDSTTNFVGNEHINHTSVTLTAGEGLTGGGDISANRTFDLDINSLTTESSSASGDYYVFYDTTAGTHKKIDHDDMPGGSGGTTTFTGLTDTPSSYTSQAGKLAAVNTGETALEFIDAPSGVTSGSTLPSTPSDGQFHLHTPTGRTWLMQYDGTAWKALRSFGACTIYVDIAANGTQDWDDGYSSGTAWEIAWISSNLPAEYDGDISIMMASGTYGTADALSITGVIGLGGSKIRYYGNTTTQVASMTYSSGSSPYQSWTMSGTVSAGSEGDIIEHTGGTLPANNAAVNGAANVWVLLSRSGTNVQIAGGIAANGTPDNTSTFTIKSRNTTFDLYSPASLNIRASSVEFWYVSFRMATSATDHYVSPSGFSTGFVGCAFFNQASGKYFRGFDNDILVACYGLNSNSSSRRLLSMLSGIPRYMQRCLIKSTSPALPSASAITIFWGTADNSYCEHTGTRVWHTQNGNLGEVNYGVKLRFNTGLTQNNNSWYVAGGSSYVLMPNYNQSNVFNTSLVTVSGGSSGFSADATTYAVQSA